MIEHDCEDYVIYINPCQDCIDNDQECVLNTHGICSICGEVIDNG